jgi:dihydrofolate reductase
MRKVFAFIVTTLDGYYEGPNAEFDWPVVDAEFFEFAIAQLDEIDTLLFGRVTYEQMAAYWPTPAAQADNPAVATAMNSLPKIVVSRTLDKAEWNNSRLLNENVAEELAELKQGTGKDIAIFGSSELTVNLLRLGLVDELRIMVNPVVLGAGRSLLHTAEERISLRLCKSRVFDSGNVLLYYEPVAG